MTQSARSAAEIENGNGAGTPVRAWMLWHLLATLIVALAPSQIYLRQPLWVVRSDHQLALLMLAAAYFLAALGLVWQARARATRQQAGRDVLDFGLGTAIVGVLAAFGLCFFLMLCAPLEHSRGTLILSTALAVGLMALGTQLRDGGLSRATLAGLAVGTLGLVGLGIATADRFEPANLRTTFAAATATAGDEADQIESHLYSLKTRTLRNYFGVHPNEEGGAIAPLGDGLIISTATGELFGIASLDAPSLSGATAQPLGVSVPMNRTGYRAHIGESTAPSYFRLTDLLVDNSSGVDLYAVHTDWIAEEECMVMRVSKASWPSAEDVFEGATAQWQTVYTASPCLLLQSENQGGRLALTRDGRFILSLGDFDFDGVKNPERFAQDPAVDYGKILEIDPVTGQRKIISLGHRNPQGLFAASDGSLWSTEHGPRGGDELNRILPGANYGWPNVTYGTAYYKTTWPLSDVPGSHTGFAPPIFSWVPSVATTNLIRIEGDTFSLWRDDFLVASLKERSLWRVRVEDNGARYSERIEVGERIRDLVVDNAGRLVAWADGGTLILIEAENTNEQGEPTVAAGRRIFAGCTGCHSISGSNGTAAGPDLLGVFGRPVASLPGYAYSSALAAIDAEWNAESLDAFLEEPSQFAPGAGRGMPGVSDALDRASLIEYLKTLQ